MKIRMSNKICLIIITLSISLITAKDFYTKNDYGDQQLQDKNEKRELHLISL